MNEIKIQTWNVRGCRNFDKRLSIFRHLKREKCLIYMLQETHVIESDITEWRSNWQAGEIFINPGTSRSAGQAFLINGGLNIIEHKIFIMGRLHILKFQIKDITFSLLNIYAPNVDTDRNLFFDNIIDVLGTYDYGDRIILGGDFNVVLEKDDKFQGSDRACKSQEKLKSLIKSFELLDIWRDRNRKIKRYTWSQPNPLIKCRLDFFLIQKPFEKSVKNSKILTAIKSDHSIVEITIDLEKVKRGRGFWKFNSSVLSETKYKTDMSELIEKNWNESVNMTDTSNRFDWLKYNIMKYSRKYCSDRAMRTKTRESDLLIDLETIDKKMCSMEATDEEITNYHLLKQELEHITEERARGAWIRSRIEFIEKDEKSNSFFFNKSKNSYEKKTIEKLVDVDEGEMTCPKQILNYTERFYTTLYSSTKVDDNLISTNLQSISSNKILPDDLRNSCEGVITVDECWEALKYFKPNKSPGSDGLTAEFYKTFWRDIGPKLVDSFNYCKINGMLSLSQRRGVITLLQKKGKDGTKLSNWRPVSLLNIDYKILTKTLAKRIEKCLPAVISPDQSGFLKERYIGEGVRFIEDLIEYHDNNSLSGILVQLDFEKAFDSVEWNFMLAALKKFGFGDNLIDWIKCCYTQIFSCVLNNGHSTKWFELFRGMRQGCALSCYLFIICVEIMACMIRENKDIKGIVVNVREHKIKQFADDCTCTLKDKTSVLNLINTISIFTAFSGLKLNLSKSLLVYLGPWRYKKEKILNMEISHGCFNLLGIFVGRGKEEKQSLNFKKKIDKMKCKLQIWSKRDLSLSGRVLISKSHGVSNIIYSLSMTDAENSVIADAQKELNAFLWNYKPPKVKHTVMISDEAGLKSLDVESQAKALRIPWIYRILNNTGWADYAQMFYEKIGGLNFILRCHYSISKLPEIPLFYSNLLKYAHELFVTPYSEYILWNNKHITVNNLSIYFKDWHIKGVVYVQDLCKEDGTWLSFAEFTAKYGIRSNYLRYFGIVSAVKNAIKKAPELHGIDLTQRPEINFGSNLLYFGPNNPINISKAKSKIYYKEIIGPKYQTPSVLNKWLHDYNIHSNIVLNSLDLTKKSCSESKLISFQFKIIHNIVNNGTNLHKWGIRNTPNCIICKKDISDSLIHALVQCEITCVWLDNIFEVIDQNNNLRNISREEFIFGVDDCATNLIYLIIKKHISDLRGYQKPFNAEILLRELYKRIIADKNSLTDMSFSVKWAQYTWLVTKSLQYYQEYGNV